MNKTEKMPEVEKYEGWYCRNCNEGLSGARVTYEENCDTCGHPVEWIEGELVDTKELLSFCTQQAEKMQELEEEKREAVSLLYRYKHAIENYPNEEHGIILFREICSFLSTQEKGDPNGV